MVRGETLKVGANEFKGVSWDCGDVGGDVGGDDVGDVDDDGGGDDGDGDDGDNGDDDDDGDDGKCEVETCREWCLFQVWWRGQLWW